MDVSIIIVNYNTKVLIFNCLKSVYEHTNNIQFEVIVSDNGSTDGSIGMIKTEFTEVILIVNNANLGFGAANNRGLKMAKGKYVFYLNSDTLLLNNAVKIFYDFWENSPDKEKIGALGANLLDKKGNITHSYGVFPTYPLLIKDLFHQTINSYIKCCFRILNISYEKLRKNTFIEKKIGEVEYITGADLFVLNNQDAYFDEQFFLYYEETDLEYQLNKKNLKRIVIDGPKIIHCNGGSNNESDDLYYIMSFSHRMMCKSRILYCKKNLKNTVLLCFVIFFSNILLLNPYLKTK